MNYIAADTWRYALLGGIASIPLSAGLYWLTAAGSTFSLNMVFFGGVLAGYFAEIRAPQIDITAVGIRTGLVGGLPALVLLLEATSGLAGPVWFRAVGGLLFVGTFVVFTFAIAVVAGAFGAVGGSWLAGKTRG
ncbi:DUF5518 domain-containing protein [Halolamina sediminis]|jgi:hypothetical protein|uniref:DUF5518 domain-containing protein n=1 Tax=Halolamina sediminis TaxID=1480675 RepID=UPI0006B54494|nr:DUF5518 domain-containing protein [Halolamina sediminis]